MTAVLGTAAVPVAVSGTRKWWALGALGLAGLVAVPYGLIQAGQDGWNDAGALACTLKSG